MVLRYYYRHHKEDAEYNRHEGYYSHDLKEFHCLGFVFYRFISLANLALYSILVLQALYSSLRTVSFTVSPFITLVTVRRLTPAAAAICPILPCGRLLFISLFNRCLSIGLAPNAVYICQWHVVEAIPPFAYPYCYYLVAFLPQYPYVLGQPCSAKFLYSLHSGNRKSRKEPFVNLLLDRSFHIN